MIICGADVLPQVLPHRAVRPALISLTLLAIGLLCLRVHHIYRASIQELIAALRSRTASEPQNLQTIEKDSPEIRELGRIYAQLDSQLAYQESKLADYRSELDSVVEDQTKKLRDQRDYVKSILEFMIEGLFVTDSDGRICTTNPSALTLIGQSHSDVEGRPLDDLFHDEPAHSSSKIIPLVHEAGVITHRERHLIGKDGKRIPVAVSASIMRDAHEQVSGVVCLLLDMTERKKIEREISRARDEAIAADKLKSEFLATMSHEIRTPMNGVVGLTSLLVETQLNKEQREFAEAINACGQSLLTIINDILDFSKLEAGRMKLDDVDFNVFRLIENVSDLFWAKANEKGIEIVTQNAPNLPRWVKGDSNRIRQILNNLVSNAVKFTDGGGVTIVSSLQEETASGYLIRFTVKDTGIGINSEDQKRLFHSFSQIDGSYTRAYGGTGLGLAISKQLVGLMNGIIGVQSAEGKGSEFWFEVPLTKTDTRHPEPHLKGARFPDRIALIAAPDGTLREGIRTQLQDWGVSVHEAATSLETLVLLKDAEARKRDYDILLVDVTIEHKSQTLVKFILSKTDVPGSALGVITHLGYNTDFNTQNTSIHAVLTKPVREQDLFDCFFRLEKALPSK